MRTWLGLAAWAATAGATLAQGPFGPDAVARLVAEARATGDARRGAQVFADPRFACLSCHKVGPRGGAVGPDLSAVGKCLPADEIAEAVLFPKKKVKEGYEVIAVVTADGRSLQGYREREDGTTLVLRDPATGAKTTFAKADLESRRDVGSLMPEGLAEAMRPDERRDLLRFLLDLGTERSPDPALLGPPLPVTMPLVRDPLRPEEWPGWKAPVNRARLYDFYHRQAIHFREQKSLPHLLPAFPGLDGGTFGHWGTQNENTWRDGRWNDADLGVVLSGVFRAGPLVVPRGVCVRLGAKGELAVCFNPDALRYEALWTGGFVSFSPVRHGFLDGLRPVGKLLPTPAAAGPAKGEYRGFYRHGDRVLFAYRVDGVDWLDAPGVENGAFARVAGPAATHPLRHLTRGGPTPWPQTLTTRGTLGAGSGAYVVDTIAPPFDNPWKAPLFFGDHDFLSDGAALLATMQGDVWRVDGLDASLAAVRWRRVASGLHHALGLVVSGGVPYVLGRDQITRLHDLDGDGVYDFYERHSAAYRTSPAGHDYVCGLFRDPEGRFLTASGPEGLVRISPDGKTAETLAVGFRNPDGLGLYPDGAVTVPCSEGEWTPTTMLCLVKPEAGKVPHFGYRGPPPGGPPALPMLYLPRGVDNSAGGQVFASDARWGPLQGRMIHTSFGMGSHFAILRDEVDGQAQGAAVPLPGEFLSGAHRGRFNPADGQLYVSGMAGWGNYSEADGSFQRVRFTGKAMQTPTGMRAHENGVHLTFAEPLDAKIAERPESHFAQAWNYRYGPGYGSRELSLRHPTAVGHDPVRIASAKVVDGGRGLFLEMPEIQPANQLHLVLRVGSERDQELFATVHRLAAPHPAGGPRSAPVASHPILADMVALTAKAAPNPWTKPLPGSRRIVLEAGKDLVFATRTLKAKAGEPLTLVFSNPDVVPHNWVLAKPGTLDAVGAMANRLIAEPDAVLRHYVPKSPDVVVHTDVVAPGSRHTIHFPAPRTPGRYPYLCTFPGHWMAMNGVLIVE